MSEVKRFMATCDCMSQADWGDYVRHTDYAALEAECERLQRAEKNDAIAYKAVIERQNELRQQLAEAREEISDLHSKLDKFYSKSHGIPALAEIERLREERDSFQRVCIRTFEQRDKLAGLLRDIAESESRGADWAKQIHAALAEIKP